MSITRDLIGKVLLFLILVVMGAGYYSSRQTASPVVVSVSSIESGSCGQFAATYEHNANDPNHNHNSNAYGITAEQKHVHVTADYLDWLDKNLSRFVTDATPDKYRNVTDATLAGLLYTLYRVCRVNPEQPFPSVISVVLNDLPGLNLADSYVEGSDGE